LLPDPQSCPPFLGNIPATGSAWVDKPSFGGIGHLSCDGERDHGRRYFFAR
jgi:hypothetical protein